MRLISVFRGKSQAIPRVAIGTAMRASGPGRIASAVGESVRVMALGLVINVIHLNINSTNTQAGDP